MWEISNSHQILSFAVSLLFGIAFGLFYTFFKGARRAFWHSTFAIFLEDIIFFEIISFITFLLFLAFSNGEIRFFMLLGIGLGFSAFYFILADLLSKAFAFVLKIFSKIIKRILGIFRSGLDVFFKTLFKIFSYCGQKLRNYYKYLKKPLKQGG